MNAPFPGPKNQAGRLNAKALPNQSGFILLIVLCLLSLMSILIISQLEWVFMMQKTMTQFKQRQDSFQHMEAAVRTLTPQLYGFKQTFPQARPSKPWVSNSCVIKGFENPDSAYDYLNARGQHHCSVKEGMFTYDFLI